MKQLFYILTALCLCLSAAGQNKDKKWLIDITIDQNFLLKPMIDHEKANRFMEGGTTGFTFRLYYRALDNWSVLGDVVIISPAFNNRYRQINDSYINYFGEIGNMDEYYVKDVAKNKNIAGTMKMFAGIAYHHYMKNWEIRPVLGIGLKQMEATSISYVLKKKDSNEAYSVKYEWMDNENEVENIGYLSGELDIIYYPKNRKFGWLFGVTCRHYLSGVEFWKEFRDFYTQEPIDNWSIKGQNNNMLGIKIGTTF